LIHPTAIIHKSAVLGTNVKVGPYSVIENDVTIGDDCKIGNFVTICSDTSLAEGCHVLHCSSIGEIPQDLKFDGERTKTIIGARTRIREYVTVNRGTKALGETKIGSDCLLMASTHVAHDCILGDNVIMSNLSTLGGHVEVGEWAVLGGGVLVHQFTKIGPHAFIGGGFRAVQDVPPFILAAEHPLSYKGVNSVGLKRRGFSLEDRKLIKKIYHVYFKSGLNRDDALNKIEKEISSSVIKDQIINFIKTSDRGII
jgi:UDP-N-acetylglucosamine acyltransferase